MDMEYLAELGREKGFTVQYSILYNHNKINNDLVLSDEEIRRTMKTIYDLQRDGYPIYYGSKVYLNAIQWPGSCNIGFFTSKDRNYTKGLNLVPCYHGKLKYQIDADGRVVPCWAHNDPDAPNINKLGLKEALDQCKQKKDCEFCCFIANSAHNTLMHMSPKSIMEMIILHIKDSLQIKN